MIVLWGLVGPMLGPPWGGLVGGSWGGGIRRWLGAHESRRGSRELGFCGSFRNVPGRRARRFATQVSTLVSPEPTAERHGLECRETRLETRHVRTPERPQTEAERETNTRSELSLSHAVKDEIGAAQRFPHNMSTHDITNTLRLESNKEYVHSRRSISSKLVTLVTNHKLWAASRVSRL